MLFVQGERDPFGTPDELRPILDTIPADVTLHAVIDADHSLTPPKRSGTDPATVYADIQGVIASWIAAKSS
jgi:predicted alpha/beta-hydrolase family hydrolase